VASKLSSHLLVLIIVFFSAVAVQLVFLTVFLSAFRKKRIANGISNEPVSIIVCAHDEEENLKELLPLLLNQEYPNFEVIIVNDRSNDGTYDFLLEETKKDKRVRTVHVKATPEHVNNKKFALTLGIRAAAYEWILLTDADCRPKSTQWVATMSQQFSPETQFVLGFSPYHQKSGFLNKFIQFESFITALQYLTFAWFRNPYMGVGRNMAYRKSLFLEKKGFNNFLHVVGGDDDLFVNQHANATNTRVQFAPDASVLSVPETTWKSFFQQKKRHLSVGKRYRFGHKALLGLFAVTWVLTWFTGLPLLGLYTYFYLVILALVVRWVLLIWSVQTLVKQAELVFNPWIIPVLDFVYPIYYISTGVIAFFTKKIQWRN
jgi:cellulose synthase/poly-beta-1,6-N-acetylglucosamine synthase-like glycosyltransferase